MSVLVVVPTVGPVPTKHKLFKQLQGDPHVSEVLVVDNGNCFNLKNHSHLKKFNEIDAGCNLNWLASCNLGMSVALTRSFEYVCLLNDDVTLSRQCFSGLLTAAKVNKDVGSVMPLYNSKSIIKAYDAASEEDWKPVQEDFPCIGVDGTCLLIPVRVIKAIGFLDPVFFGPGWGAAIDYRLRIYDIALKCFITRRSKVWHKTRSVSASKLYGSEETYVKKAAAWARQGLRQKYGPNWREDLNIKKAFKE